jgi:hypothetical protein
MATTTQNSGNLNALIISTYSCSVFIYFRFSEGLFIRVAAIKQKSKHELFVAAMLFIYIFQNKYCNSTALF